MLQWFRGGWGHGRRSNRVFHGLLFLVCALSLTVLLVAPLTAAFGLPAATDSRWVLAWLCVPPPERCGNWRGQAAAPPPHDAQRRRENTPDRTGGSALLRACLANDQAHAPWSHDHDTDLIQ